MDSTRKYKEEYVRASEKRVHEAAEASGVELPGWLATGILVELRTMYEVGRQHEWQDQNTKPVSLYDQFDK